MPSAKGYAVVCSHGVIDVRTVQDTEIGAIVNGLVTLARVMVTNDTSEAQIRECWDKFAEHEKLSVVPVDITVAVN